ncbi:hypothetical protein BKI52_25360 [marine bacterium AO1-C]|nr:hypothetical protein BKI52_25360 [marine bacterium AO1-C]
MTSFINQNYIITMKSLLKSMIFVCGLALFAACGSATKSENTDSGTTDTASTTATTADSGTENKNSTTEDNTSSSSTAPKDLLVAQKWVYDVEAVMKANFSEEQLSKLGEEAVKNMKASGGRMFMHFKADGTYTAVDNAGKDIKGTWTLSEDNKSIITKEEGDDKEGAVTIKELSAEKLIISRKDGEKEMTMIMVPEGSTPTKKESTPEKSNETGEK